MPSAHFGLRPHLALEYIVELEYVDYRIFYDRLEITF